MKSNEYTGIVPNDPKFPGRNLNTSLNYCRYLLIGLLLLNTDGIFNPANSISAATVTITTNVNWNAITTGTGTGGVPSLSDDVQIQNGVTLTVNVNNAVCSTITIGGGNNNTTSILKFNAASQLTVAGVTTIGSNGNRKGSVDMTLGGILKTGGSFTTPNLATFSPGTGTVEYNSTSAQAILTSITYNNLVISNNSTKSATASLTLNGSLTINSTAIFNTNSTLSVNGNLSVDGTFTQTAGASTFTGGGTHAFSGAGIIQFKDLVTTSQTIDAGSSNIKISGNWTHTTSGIFNQQTSSVTYNGSGAQTQPATTFVPQYYNLIINNGASGTVSSLAWKVNNNFDLQTGSFSPLINSSFNNVTLSGGTFTSPAGSISIAGNITNNATFTNSTGTIFLNGTSPQNIGGSVSTTFNSLTMNNSSGAVLNGGVSITVNGTLSFTTGVISTNSNKVIISTSGNVSRISGHVNGNLQKKIQVGSGITKTFEIGDANESAYAPVTLTFTNLNITGNLVASTSLGDHILTGSTFSSEFTVNRYWTITNPSSGGINFDNFDATFGYNASDVDPGVNTSTIYAGKYVSGTWSYPTYGLRTNGTVKITGETSFGDYQFGDCQKPSVNVQSLQNVSCYGGSNGAITLATSGGTSPLTFSWLPIDNNTTSVTGLIAGDYTVVTSAYGGCSTFSTITVSQPTTPKAGIAGGKNVCVSNPSCELSVTFNGGTSPWTFMYNDGVNHSITTSNNPYALSVAPGATTNYSLVSLTDVNTCPGTITTNNTEVTVNAISNGGNITSSSSVCIGTGGTLQLSGNTGNIIMWQSSTDNFNSTPVDILNTTSSNSFDNLTQKTYFRAVVQNTGCEVAYSAPTIVDVDLPTYSNTVAYQCSDALPYKWNDRDYFTTGNYQANLTNAKGCDSTATLMLTITNPTTSFQSVTECESYSWNGSTYNNSGLYSKHFINSEGCDSTATLDLTIKYNSNSEESVISCDEFTWNGISYSTSGTYAKHFVNATGCDSTATLNLTINKSSTSTTDVTECNNYLWNGINYSNSGTYTVQLTNASGCTLAATLNLTILNSTESLSQVTECDSYNWNSINYTASGIYSEHFTNAVGCDSTAVLDLKINNSSRSITSIVSCDGYSWNDTEYMTSGIYDKHFTNAAGCDSTATLDLTINYATTSNSTVSECDSYFWNGINYTSSGIYRNRFANSNGCDSTAILNLTIKKSTSSTETHTACDMYGWNGIDYPNSGTYSEHFINAEGCDSTANLILIINHSSESTTNVTECDNFSWNGIAYSTSGNYSGQFINSEGCDSTAYLNLTINKSTASYASVTECDSYLWNGITYTASGVYDKHFTNSTGCDSTATLNLNIINSTASYSSVTECDSYTWNELTYNSSGSYSKHFMNSVGCDSTANLSLIIKHNTESNTPVTECDNYIWNGNTYTVSGNYSGQFINSEGCDSTAHLDLTINKSTASYASVTECDSYIWNGITYTGSGVYDKHFTNSTGCDSTATLNLNIINSTASYSSVTECDNYTWNGFTYYSSGNYSEHFTNAVGCDSTANLNLIINQKDITSVSVTECESFTWNDIDYTTSGTYNQHFINVAGCDSSVTMDLVINYGTSSRTSVSECDSYEWNGNTYSNSGIYVKHFINSANCDSTAILNLEIRKSTSSSNTVTECESYIWNGEQYTVSGIYNKNFINAAGCDSTASLDLTITNSNSSNTTVTECDSYTWNGIRYSSSGVYEKHFTNASGCDSTAILNLTINPQLSSYFDAVTCDTYLLPWNLSVTSTGSYNHTYTTINGCDSLVTANITVNSTPAAPTLTVVSNCSGTVCTASNYSGSLLWNDGSTGSSISTTTPGTYTVSQTVNGCTSLLANAVVPSNIQYGAPLMQGSLDGPGGACRTQGNIVFSIPPASGATSYMWTLPSGASGSSSGSTITVNFNNNFNGGNICVKATNSCGASSSLCKNILRLTQPPSTPSTISGPSSLCPSSTSTYSVIASAQATSYVWSVTGGLTIISGQGTNSVVAKAGAGFVSGTIKVKSGNCQGISANTSKIIKGIPSTPIWKVNPSETACPGSCYSFNIDNVHDATTWTFTAPPGCTITSPNNGSGNPLTTTVSYVNICFPAGFVSGTISIVANNSCGQSAPLVYTIFSKPVAPALISGPTAGICNSTGVVYSIQSVRGATSYSWTVPPNTIITQDNGTSITVDFLAGFNSGNICVKARNQCGSGGKTCLAVTSSPAQPSVINGPERVCHSQRDVSYSVNPVAGATSYSWTTTGNATIISGAGTANVHVRFTSVNAPSCTLSVKAKNTCGTSSSYKMIVSVNNNCRTDEKGIVDAENSNSINVYPNPSIGNAQVSFESETNGIYTLQVIDMLGNVISNENISAVEGTNIRELHLENAAKGIYFILIQEDGMKRKSARMIIE